MFKRLLALGILMLSAAPTFASHIFGGDITWRCDSNQNYIFTLTIYADCDSNGAGLTVNQTIFGPQGLTINLSEVAVENATPGSQFCNTCLVEAHIYESTPLTLSGTPPVQGWEFSWTACCRRPSLVNTPGNEPFYLRAKMYPYTAPGDSVPLNAGQCYDQSPYFSVLEIMGQNSGNRTVLNQQAVDREADSIFVSFAEPMQSATMPMSWDTGYAANKPLPHPGIDSSHDSLILDHYSGSITTDISALATEGYYAMSLKIESWRRGQGPNGPGSILIAEVQREFPAFIRSVQNGDNCSTDPAGWSNSAPDAMIDTSAYPMLQRLSSEVYQVEAYVGDTIDFMFIGTDFDKKANCQFQEIIFSGEGSLLSYPYSTGYCTMAPCATVTPKPGQSGYSSPLSNELRFEWVPEIQHVNPLDWMAGEPTRHIFNLRFSDNFCPLPASSSIRLEVLLKRRDFFAEDEQLLTNDALRVYPNPIADHFSLDLDPRLRESEMQVSIFDLSGKRVYHHNWQGAGSAPLVLPSPSAKGVYLLSVTVAGEVYTTKIVK